MPIIGSSFLTRMKTLHMKLKMNVLTSAWLNLLTRDSATRKVWRLILLSIALGQTIILETVLNVCESPLFSYSFLKWHPVYLLPGTCSATHASWRPFRAHYAPLDGRQLACSRDIVTRKVWPFTICDGAFGELVLHFHDLQLEKCDFSKWQTCSATHANWIPSWA